jgi:RNA polymerase sigma-70 factor (ECF subfamily)
MSVLNLFAGANLRDRLAACRPRLYRLARVWLNDRAAAEDLAQDTLLRAWAQRGTLRRPESLEAWLFTIMANAFRDHLRRRREWVAVEEDDLLAGNTPESDAEQAGIVRRVRAAVARLNEAQRQVLTLVDLEDCSYARTADILGIPAGTVMSRLARAREALRRELQEEDTAARMKLKVVK